MDTPQDIPSPAEAPETAAAENAAPPSAPNPGERPLPPPRFKEPKLPLPSSLQEIVGALLFASEHPLSVADIRQTVRGVAPEETDDAEVMEVYRSCTTREVEQALHGLEKELERSACGFRLVCAGGAYRLQTAPQCGRYVRALLKLDKPNRLTRAALETLAIIAYRQPITKSEIEQIRGVAVDAIVKTLVDLQLVRLVGRSELPGHPFLYGTTPAFLEHFGLASLSELNAIDPTLQRSNPKERAKLFVREKPAPAPAPAEETAPAPAAAPENAPAEETAPAPAEPEDTAPITSAGISATGEDDVFIDDSPEDEPEDEEEFEDEQEDEFDEEDQDEFDEDEEEFDDDEEN